MNENFFENGVLFTQYFCVTQRLIQMDVALYVSSVFLSVTQYIFLFKKQSVHVTTVVY